jgi:hypothetical protein
MRKGLPPDSTAFVTHLSRKSGGDFVEFVELDASTSWSWRVCLARFAARSFCSLEVLVVVDIEIITMDTALRYS